MAKRIVIMAGGTGGHVYPALAVAQYLLDQQWQVSWIGTEKGLEARVVPEHQIAIDWLTVAGLRGKTNTQIFKAPLMLALACYQALTILRCRKPDVVLGMGGFVAGPGGLMARVLGIPLVIHEQNRIPGTTNRVLAKFATRVLQAFPDSFANKIKATYTGNPLRREIANLSKPPNQQRKVLHILIVGGSLGAQILNQTVPEALAKVGTVSIKHQTGSAMEDQVRSSYQQLGVAAEVSAFIEDMAAYYQWADLIICRAGAMTISEIAAVGLPSILIPYPFAIDDHQLANAQYLVEANASVIIKQDQLTAEVLSAQIKQLAAVPATLTNMSIAARSCAKLDATTAVSAICCEQAKP